MSLHLNEWGDSSPRAEQPRRAGARARQPATSSQLCVTAQRRDRRSRSASSNDRRPSCTPRGPAPREINPDHVGTSSPVVARGPCRSFLPGRGQAANQALNDACDRHQPVVFHRIASSFRVEPALLPGVPRRVSGSLPEGRSPCWSTPTSGRSLPRCRKSHPRARRSVS